MRLIGVDVGGTFTDLVYADTERVFLSDVDFDPRAALGNDAAGMQALAGGVDLGREVAAGAALELGDDDPLRPVDHEFAAADHRRAELVSGGKLFDVGQVPKSVWRFVQ